MASPPPPTNVQASDGEFTNGVLVQWDWDGTEPLLGFEIWRWLDGEAPVYYDAVLGGRDYLDRLNKTDIPSDPKLVYNYAVKAIGADNGPSPLSASDSGFIRFVPPININDTKAPVVRGLSPVDGANGVPVDSNLVVTFDEAIARGVGSLEIRTNSAVGPLFEIFLVSTSNRLTILGNTLTIDPTRDLAPNTQYVVVLRPGAIRDVAGNNYGGFNAYDFVTAPLADTAPPRIVTFSPADGAANVAVGTNFRITFNEAIARGVTAIELRLGSATGDLVESFDVATSDRLTISGTTLTINPTDNLAAGAQYVFVIQPDAVVDLAGNAYLGFESYDFRTAGDPVTGTPSDTTPPRISSLSPDAGATGVSTSADLSLIFNESIVRGAGAIELRVGSITGELVESFDAASSSRLIISDNILTVDPTGTLNPGTSYVLIVQSGAVRDLAGNRFAGFGGFNFTTAEEIIQILNGTAQDDRLVGSRASENFTGGAGLDTVVFTGARSSYDIVRTGETVTVRDLRANGDGTDTLTGIERLQFSDGVMGVVPERLVVLQPNTGDLLSWDTTLGSQGFAYLTRLGSGTSVLGVADLTGDGRADLLIQQADGGLIRWDLSRGSNGFAALTPASGFTVVGTGDLTGDSAADVLLRNAAGELRVLDPASNSIRDLFTLAQGWSLKGIANINGSGKADIVLQNDTSGAVIAFTEQGWRDLITLDPASDWQIVGFGDVLGGLADDFVIRDPLTGVTVFWNATQGSQGFQDFATIAQEWTLLAISDLSGDGRDDVIFQNSNGLAVYWSGTNWVDLGSTLVGAQLQGAGLFA